MNLRFIKQLRKVKTPINTFVLKNNSNTLSNSSKSFKKHWREHFAQRYALTSPPLTNTEEAEASNLLHECNSHQFYYKCVDKEITEKEFKTALKKSRRNAAGGLDGIRPSYIKDAPSEIIKYIFNALKTAFNEEDLLRSLKTVLICPFLKPGKKDETDPVNYRPIALLSQFLKLFESILYSRISNYLEGFCSCSSEVKFHDFTNGFRFERRTLDNI